MNKNRSDISSRLETCVSSCDFQTQLHFFSCLDSNSSFPQHLISPHRERALHDSPWLIEKQSENHAQDHTQRRLEPGPHAAIMAARFHPPPFQTHRIQTALREINSFSEIIRNIDVKMGQGCFTKLIRDTSSLPLHFLKWQRRAQWLRAYTTSTVEAGECQWRWTTEGLHNSWKSPHK